MDFSGRCVKCGKCKSVCPTYRVVLKETASPRGRMHLIEAAQKGSLSWEKAAASIETCLLCMACEEACPQRVKITERVMEARARTTSKRAEARAASWFARLAPKLAEHPRALHSSSSKTCVLYTGCVIPLAFPRVEKRCLELLWSLGYRVLKPEIICCGHPHLASGRLDEAFYAAQTLSDTLPDAEVITPCSTCASHMKKSLDARVLDITELIVEHTNAFLPAKSLPRPVAFHTPCHLKRGQGIDLSRALKEIFGEIHMLSENCCGFGGTVSARHPGLSLKVAEQRIKEAISKKAKAIITTCPACMIQLKRASLATKSNIEVLHLVEAISI